ncbi:hypothetical protein [Phytoactinopolyspora halotolerans]|uniref:Uncharacterized protein n=1 Tax=Phytoactinopolyspora halotolerans TaxID=1981512 RepID=A0A6L9SFM0_9ACTN|nr:hypothetical protein [Phytoactinopolyspora halotolerans]NEE03883.1 hypothetical protein [Phytoactinopolyspora halotolerans]
MRGFRPGMGALAALGIAVIGLATAAPATAESPTRVSDTTTSAFIEASEGDRSLEIGLWRSDAAGTQAYARLSGGPEGEHIAEGWSTSEWQETTFRATIEVFDDDGRAAGTVNVNGSYAPAGEPIQNVQKFNDGNVRVHMDHTFTELAIDDVAVTLDGAEWEIGFTGGEHEVGTLFYTNPATYVTRGQYLAFGDASTENIADYSLEGTLDDLGLNVEFADAEASTAGALDLSSGAWTGTHRLLAEGGEELGDVQVTATLTPSGKPIRLFDHLRGGYERWTVTLYELVITVEGPQAPARLVVEVADVSYAIHTPPEGGFHG